MTVKKIETTENDGRIHSVYLDEEKCRGCRACLQSCPTQAIRMIDNKGFILSKYCTDCGECVRRCESMAKRTRYDSHRKLTDFKYNVILPDPVLFAQFNHLTDNNILLTALKMLGFDDVFEVAAAAELVSKAQREYAAAHPGEGPFISTVCPVVTRLVKARFPGLIDNLMPILPPMEVAAQLARKQAVKKTGLAPEEIGIYYISPCPARVTAVKNPIGYSRSNIDRVVAVKKVYPSLLSVLPAARENPEPLSKAMRIGNCFSINGGECRGFESDHYLAADGIENVIRVLGDLEDDKLQTEVDFLELSACPAGCVGGVLTVENPFIARTKIISGWKQMPKYGVRPEDFPEEISYEFDQEIEYDPAFELGSTVKESVEMMAKIEEYLKQLPRVNCGCCGTPSCRSLAVDAVKGMRSLDNCIYFRKTKEKENDSTGTD